MIIYADAAGCPNTCRHCSVDGHAPHGDFYAFDELRRLKQEWGPLVIYYEPTAHSAFPQVYDESIAVENGGWLVTNGFGLARREDSAEVFAKMAALGINTVAFTLHGLREHHDWFVCREGAFDDILLATRRARAVGFRVNWQIYVDRRGIGGLPELIDMAGRECDGSPELGIPAHRVGGRLRHYEAIRPTREDARKWRLHRLVDDPRRNSLTDPDSLTAAAWIERWRQNPQGDEFKHPFEPRSWPASLSFEWLTVRFRRDRKVFFDTMVAAPIHLGALSEGKDALLGRVSTLPTPPHVEITPDEARFAPEELERLHPSGASVRYAAISKARQCGSASISAERRIVLRRVVEGCGFRATAPHPSTTSHRNDGGTPL